MQTILYARVSTEDQTIEHQRTQAEAAGFVIDHVVADHGVSGLNMVLSKRPEGRRLFDMLRKGDTLGGPSGAQLSGCYGHNPAPHAAGRYHPHCH